MNITYNSKAIKHHPFIYLSPILKGETAFIRNKSRKNSNKSIAVILMSIEVLLILINNKT